jgi:biopolymer transport protein ExbD
MAHRLTAREKAEAELKNPPEEDPEFQIAPMIDILLVLMVFFMTISSTEVLQANRDIILPVARDAKTKEGSSPGQMIVNVTWVEMTNTGGVEIDTVKYPNPAFIVPRLEQGIKANPLARVLIRADRGVKWDFLRAVLVAVGQSGVSNVTFSVVDKDVPGQGKPAGGN